MSEHDLGETATPSPWTHARQLLEFAVARSPVIFYVAALRGDAPIRFISSNVEAMTGHPPQAFLVDPLYGRRFVHPDDIDAYSGKVAELEAAGTVTCEYRFQATNGEYLWIRDELRLSPEGDCEPEEFVGCMTDITREKRAQEQFRDADEQRGRLWTLLRDAIECLRDGFAVYDPDHRLVICNRAFAETYEEIPEKLVGVALEEISRQFVKKIHTYDNLPITGSEEDARNWHGRIRSGHDSPAEVKLRDGRWLLVASHPTSEGGLVVMRTDITKQKGAEMAARESEEHFRSIVEGHPLPVFLSDVESGDILYESPATARLVGREHGSRETENIIDYYMNSADRPPLIQRLRMHGEFRNQEVMMRRLDGTAFWASMSSRLIVYKGREAALTSVVDLSEHKRRELELRQAREVLEDAIESLPEGFALFDGEDRLLLCNSRFRESNSLSADVLKPGVNWLDFIRTGAERGQYMDAIGKVNEWIEGRRRHHSLGTGAPGGVEFQQSDGRWYHAFSQLTRQGGYVGIRIDITQRKQMELALRENEALVRRILEACPVPIQMTRASDGEMIYESPASKALFGGGDGPVQSALDYYENPEDRRAYLAALEARGAVDDYEIRFKRRSGETFWAAVSARLIEFRGEEVIVSSTKDLTERNSLDEEISRQRRALYQSEKLSALGTLLAGVAHELNNPLTVVVAQAVLMKETAHDPRIAERAEKIEAAADRCARIVKSFLAMARQQPARSQALNINDVIGSSLELAGYSLRLANVHITMRLAPELPAICGDPDHLTQVFTNLFVNAQQALATLSGPRRLEVTSTHRADLEQILIKVTDNGPGVPAEIRSQIFDPFFTTKDTGVGTGIGLALCHRVIESHGGSIALDDAADGGTTFAIRLPVSNRGMDADALRRDEADAASGRSVLVIDDEPEVADVVAETLRVEGYRVEAVHSGRLALKMLEHDEFDAILSDLRMPELDGPELYRVLRERMPRAARRIAFLTGDALSPGVRAFLKSADRPHLTKPISVTELRAVIRTLVDES